MVHWGFLILTFIAGFAACYGLAKLYGRVMGAVEDAYKFDW